MMSLHTVLLSPSPGVRVGNAMTTKPAADRRMLINALSSSLLSAGIWQKLDLLCVFAAADSQAALLNWINPGGTSASIIGSPTFTADSGFTGDASAAAINSNINLSTLGGKASLDNMSLFCWSLTDTSNDGYVDVGTGNLAQIYPRRSDGNMLTRLGALTNSTASVSDSLGLSVISRGSNAAYDRYRNATSLGAVSVASAGMNNATVRALCGGQGQPFSGRKLACFGAGSFLTANDVTALYNALHTYLLAVGAVGS